MPTTGDNAIELKEYADENAATYLLMEVENFDASARHSYLRLGAVDPAIVAKYEDLVENGTAQTWDNATGEDLASLITTFVDDERYRGASGDKFFTMTEAERRTETKLLHQKGGWRDHTDGNRITTTRGDKIEVIRGNYKMRVLGRSQWTGSAGSGLHMESSGGITYQYDEVPGQIIDVRWSNADGTWRVFEECDTGHLVTRYHGVMKEWSRGGDVVDRVGSKSAYDSKYFDWPGGDDGFDSDSDFDRPDNSTHNDGVTWPSSETLASVREEVYASSIYEKTICRKMETYEGSFQRWCEKVEDEMYVDSATEEVHFDRYDGMSIALTMAMELWGGRFTESFDGEGISIKLGAFIDVRAAAASELNAAIGLASVDIAGTTTTLEASIAWLDATLAVFACEFETGAGRATVSLNKANTKGGFARFALATFLG